MKQNKSMIFGNVFALILTLLCLIPFCYVLLRSFWKADGSITFQHYYDVFLSEPKYLNRFWKSLGLSCCIAAGQLAASVLAGYGFAKCRFKGKSALFFFLMILMILPLQVTLVPNYIVLDQLNLLDTYYALALPAIFIPLGTFIMTQSFRSIPDDIIEAAKLDGCSLPGILARIAIPMNKSGLVCTMLLSFLDGWNMVEQPIAYIKDFERYPIAVALASVPTSDTTTQLVCCLLVVLPPALLFAYFNKELVEGITLAKEK